MLLLSCTTNPNKSDVDSLSSSSKNQDEVKQSDPQSPKTELSEEEGLQRFRQILNKYEEMLLTYGNPESHYYEAYEVFKAKLESGETSFRYNPTNTDPLKGSANFSHNDQSGEYFISAGPGLVEIYETCPSFVFSVLTHEHWHARDFIVDRQNFLRQLDDPFEAEYYEADAIVVEAMFINEVLVSNGFPISKFESYLLDCARDNQIGSFTSAMYQTDLAVLHRLSDIVDGFRGIEDRSSMDEQLESEGRSLLRKYQEAVLSDDWQVYSSLVSMRTFVDFSATTFKKTEGAVDPTQLWDEVLDMYTGFESVLIEMDEIITERTSFIDEKNDQYLKYFTEDLYINRRG